MAKMQFSWKINRNSLFKNPASFYRFPLAEHQQLWPWRILTAHLFATYRTRRTGSKKPPTKKPITTPAIPPPLHPFCINIINALFIGKGRPAAESVSLRRRRLHPPRKNSYLYICKITLFNWSFGFGLVLRSSFSLVYLSPSSWKRSGKN